jgi:hypothetical protein
MGPVWVENSKQLPASQAILATGRQNQMPRGCCLAGNLAWLHNQTALSGCVCTEREYNILYLSNE